MTMPDFQVPMHAFLRYSVLALLLGSAGCTDLSPIDSSWTIEGSSCSDALEPYCRIEAGELYVSGLMFDDVNATLLVHHLDVPLHLIHLDLTSLEAIKITTACQACPVRLSDSTIAYGRTGLAFSVDHESRTRLEVVDVNFKQILALDDMDQLSYSIGLKGPNIDVHMSNVSAEAPHNHKGKFVNMDWWGSGTVTANNVSVSGFASAFYGRFTKVFMTETTILCTRAGIAVSPPPALQLNGVRMSGCNDDGYQCLTKWHCHGVLTTDDAQVANPALLPPASISNSSFTGFGAAVYLPGSSHILISNSSFKNNLIGLQAVAATIHIDNSTFSGNTDQGARIWSSHATVLDSTFNENGLGAEGFSRGVGLEIGPYPQELDTPLHQVHWNSFEGNERFALYASDEATDARYNWWGTAAGPNHIWFLPEPIPPEGDVAFGTALLLEPHLTSRP